MPSVQALTLPETVLEAARQVLQVPHAAAASGLTPDGLLTPLDCEGGSKQQQTRPQQQQQQPVSGWI